MKLSGTFLLPFMAYLLSCSKPSGTTITGSPVVKTGVATTGVRGTGTVSEEGFSFTVTMNVFQVNGAIHGEVITRIDFRAFGLGIINFTCKPVCLRFEGDNSVYVGGIVETTNSSLIALGTSFVTLVRDLPGGDIMHGEFGGDCDNPPSISETPLARGDFVVF